MFSKRKREKTVVVMVVVNVDVVDLDSVCVQIDQSLGDIVDTKLWCAASIISH